MNKVDIVIPNNAQTLIDEIQRNGYEAYTVGGCVRDSVLGRQPNDWDICTNAKPDTVCSVFSNRYHVIETGIRHGTVTVVVNNEPYEITTYRIDGEYTDNRRPDSVQFTDKLTEDLSRRDFTINAMAYNGGSVVDPFGGMQDCSDGIIRCVGDAKKRFDEDALRILRALRFAAVLGFTIEEETKKAVKSRMHLLKNVSAERINTELKKLICGVGAADILDEFKDVFALIIPELQPMFGFMQYNEHHIYDVWGHTLKAVDFAGEDLIISLVMLFHDIGKPQCFFRDENGIGHFYGHEKISADIAERSLIRLKFDNKTINAVKELVYYHGSEIIVGRKYVKRRLNRLGEEQFRRLLAVKRCDTSGLNPIYIEKRMCELDKLETILNEVLSEHQCFNMKSLAVNGRNLMDMGITDGKRIGSILNRLLKLVIDDELNNDKVALMEKAAEINEELLS